MDYKIWQTVGINSDM